MNPEAGADGLIPAVTSVSVGHPSSNGVWQKPEQRWQTGQRQDALLLLSDSMTRCVSHGAAALPRETAVLRREGKESAVKIRADVC